jgi:hypothetical protein
MKGIKVEELKVKGYDFEGYISLFEQDVKVAGTFSVKFDGQYPTVRVDEMYQVNTMHDVDVMDEEVVNLHDLECQIADTDDGSWYDDHIADMYDRARSPLEDR